MKKILLAMALAATGAWAQEAAKSEAAEQPAEAPQPAVQQPTTNNTTIIIQQPADPPKTGRENGYNPHGYNL